jgi:predicted alpha/beta hydrolase
MSEFTRQVVPVGEHRHIVARFFAPAGEPRAAVLVVPAMGVTQAYYAPFAQWLAAQGFLAATFDYRGIGQSRHGSLRKVETDILDWARLDCAAMIDAMRRILATSRSIGSGTAWAGRSCPSCRTASGCRAW